MTFLSCVCNHFTNKPYADIISTNSFFRQLTSMPDKEVCQVFPENFSRIEVYEIYSGVWSILVHPSPSMSPCSIIQLYECNKWNLYKHCGEEIYFSFRRNEFSVISPQGNRSILLKPCGETVKFSTWRNENSIFFTKMNRRVSKRTMEQFYQRRFSLSNRYQVEKMFS